MISRRTLLMGLAAFGAGVASLGGYAVGVEPMRHRVTRDALTPPGWSAGLKIRLAVITDLHACKPWMSEARIETIVAETNALSPDVTVLLGDYVAGRRISGYSNPVEAVHWARALAGLRAPLGIHAILGNHDWWEDADAQRTRSGPPEAHRALLDAGIPVYENEAQRLVHHGRPFWIMGLGDQWAFFRRRGVRRLPGQPYYDGRDDLAAALARIDDAAPVVCLAHEPDIFPTMPARVSLTLSGHTHGGQVRVLGYAPFVPSRFGQRYLYGHVVEDGRHLIVSAGLGCSGLPVRFGATPEIVLVDLG